MKLDLSSDGRRAGAAAGAQAHTTRYFSLPSAERGGEETDHLGTTRRAIKREEQHATLEL